MKVGAHMRPALVVVVSDRNTELMNLLSLAESLGQPLRPTQEYLLPPAGTADRPRATQTTARPLGLSGQTLWKEPVSLASSERCRTWPKGRGQRPSHKQRIVRVRRVAPCLEGRERKQEGSGTRELVTEERMCLSFRREGDPQRHTAWGRIRAKKRVPI